MVRKNLLLAFALTFGFSAFNLAYADNDIVFDPSLESLETMVVEDKEVPLGNMADDELKKLLAINEQQTKIENIQEVKVEKEQNSSSTNADKLIEIAKSKLGSSYVYGSSGPNSFDCSGFTVYMFKQIGVSLPRVASSQAYGAKTVAKSDLQKGDLVFFNTYGAISHVGIYIENGNFIHASSYGRGVVINNINDSYYAPRYVTAARYL